MWKEDISEYDVDEYGQEHDFEEAFERELAAWEARKVPNAASDEGDV